MSGESMAGVSVVVVVLAFIVLSIIGANQTGNNEGRREMQQEAIERGFAEYDAKTGEWKWKGDETK